MTSGWRSDFPTFQATAAGTICGALRDFVGRYSPEQDRAWRDSIPWLQREVGEVLAAKPTAATYGAILEYRLPYEARRPDVVLLAGGAVVVLELKGKAAATRADLDQAAAYARDLRAYHRECHDREVVAVLVPTGAAAEVSQQDGVFVVGPDGVDSLVQRLAEQSGGTQPGLEAFLDDDAYAPLPTIVQAARELFESRDVRRVWRARAATDPAVDAISEITHQAAREKGRHLVLITGVPGAGKTLVGMRAVHSPALDDLVVERKNGKPTVPGLYLTGNGPLAEVLKWELKKAGGGGATFVRHIKSYLDSYILKPDRIPPEHLLVFDEAQRAFSADMVADKHPDWPLAVIASEPELFVRICDRMPEWSVLVGLIGGGQEIYKGEEEGLRQWRDAVERSAQAGQWTVHVPPDLEELWRGSPVPAVVRGALDLTVELRSHVAGRMQEFVAEVLEGGVAGRASAVAEDLFAPGGRPEDGFRVYGTRDLDVGKAYLRERYSESPDARFGLLASSRDKSLVGFGVDNSFQTVKQLKKGRWFGAGDEDERSCRQLEECATEFDAQGLELEMALVCWGEDFLRADGKWSAARAKRYQNSGRARIVDAFRLRQNAYRVLLTRGRDGVVIFVPLHEDFDETWAFLLECGVRELEA